MVKLGTVIGHGVGLLPHFIEHYSKYVDIIYISVYVSDVYPDLESEVKEIIKNYNNVKIFKTIKDRNFDWAKVTMLYNFMKMKNPNDWWVIADIDEFHLYPDDSLDKLIEDCQKNNWDVVRGGFIDRIGENGEFSELKEKKSIFKQYPNAGFFRYPMSKACPNKICVMRGYVELTDGQHYAKIDGQTTWKWQGWSHPLIAPIETHSVQVHHFKWDKTSIERVRSVASNNQDYSYSEEYRLMYKELAKTKFKINLDNVEFMFEKGLTQDEFKRYKNWNKLIKKITSI
jgi:hypothetical protein